MLKDYLIKYKGHPIKPGMLIRGSWDVHCTDVSEWLLVMEVSGDDKISGYRIRVTDDAMDMVDYPENIELSCVDEAYGLKNGRPMTPGDIEDVIEEYPNPNIIQTYPDKEKKYAEA